MQQLETDIVVCGGGFSGLSAAITAREGGADVILMEKKNVLGGTSNFVEGTYGLESPVQIARNIAITRRDAFHNHMAYGHWQANAALVRALFDKAAENIKLLMQMGVEFQDVIAIWPGGPEVWHVFKAENARTRGVPVVKLFAARAKKAGVRVITGIEATGLLRDKSKMINGVLARNKDGGTVRVKSRAVILSTGSFSNNREMLSKYTRFGTAQAEVDLDMDGSGIKMAWDAGAAAEGLATVLGQVVLKGVKLTTSLNTAIRVPHLWVNQLGERFCAEDVNYETVNTVANQPGGVVYIIFDEAAKNAMEERGASVNHAEAVLTPPKRISFDADIKKGVRDGYVFTADSLPELAKKIGVDAGTFRETLDRYNRCCRQRYDDMFFKKEQYLEPVATPKFYALKGCLGITTTVGGIKINHKTEVVDKDDNIIPGLYAVGICAGGMYGDTYDISNTTGGASAFAFGTGRIAGENVLEYIK